jgi:anthraniloyl-CoA monooxygenase
VPQQRPVYGRMFQASFADWAPQRVGIATMTVGAITTPDQVNTLVAAGKADLVALARPHLANPYFTLQASAWYQHMPQHWPPQYLSGRDQAFRLAQRDRAELIDTKLRARPASHEVKVDEAQEEEFARVGTRRKSPAGRLEPSVSRRADRQPLAARRRCWMRGRRKRLPSG